MQKITAKKLLDLGIKSTGYNIFLNGRQIGGCTVDNLDSVLSGNLKLVRPVYNWNSTFSNDLKIAMGLSLKAR